MKLSFKNITLIAVVAGFTAGGVAVAKHHSGGKGHSDRAERMFERMDADKDGKVTAEEAVALATEHFAKLDSDGDGVISRGEREQFRNTRREDRRTKRFEKIDADGDGMITLDEFKEAKFDRRGMRGKHHARGKHGHHGMRRGGGLRGVSTIEEARVRATQRFERIDSDNDGVITLEDVKAMKSRRGRRH